MITILMLPDMVVKKIEGDKLSIKEILDHLGLSDEDSIAIVVNGRLINDLDQVVEKNSRIVIIRQALGG